MSEEVVWPKKRRELHNHHFDSTIWNDFKFRNNDIVIATYAKSGTTWMQQIGCCMVRMRIWKSRRCRRGLIFASLRKK